MASPDCTPKPKSKDKFKFKDFFRIFKGKNPTDQELLLAQNGSNLSPHQLEKAKGEIMKKIRP